MGNKQWQRHLNYLFLKDRKSKRQNVIFACFEKEKGAFEFNEL